MIRHITFRILLNILFCLFLYSCTDMPEALNTADRMMEKYPDSALSVLRHLSPNACSSPPNRAFYNLLLVRALDKNLLPLKPDSILDFSIQYYTTHQNNELLAICYLYKGRMHKYSYHLEKAMEYYLKALDLEKGRPDNVLSGRIHLDMGDILLLQREYGASRQKYNQAYGYFTSAGYQPQAFYSLLNLGRTYHAAKDYQRAQKFYHSICPYAKDSLQKGSVWQEIAINFYDDRQFDSARFYFRQVLQYPFIENNRAVRYYYFADLLFDLKQYDSASLYAGNALSFKPDIYTLRECYRILANTSYLKGNKTGTKHYMNSYVNITDSIRKIDRQMNGRVMESVHSLYKEVEKTKNILGYVILFFLFVILSVVLMHSRRMHNHKKEKLLWEKMHTKQKTNIRKEVMLKRGESLLQKMDQEKLKQSVLRKNASYAEKERMDRQLYDEFLHLNDPDFFYREMDSILNNLITKLRTRYTALTNKEINWCCFYLLHIPTTDIYLLLDYKVGSLIKMKQRLAQKVGVAGVANIYNFLDDILAE